MRPEKQIFRDEIKQKIDNSEAFILLSYKDLNPNLIADFRLGLIKAGSDLEVVRKNILLKAAEATGCVLDANLLKGHIAVVFAGKEPSATTKLLFNFKKETKDAGVEILGGRFDGTFYSASDVEQISALPGIEQMRAEFLGLLESVQSQTLGAIDSLLTSVVYCLDNKIKN